MTFADGGDIKNTPHGKAVGNVFTGLIEHVGGVKSVTMAGAGTRITLDAGPLTAGVKPGDSIAVNGVCLTVATIRGEELGFDVVAETLAKSTLSRLKPGASVNLERAMTPTGRFGGHIVQGHVDGVAYVAGIVRGTLESTWTFSSETALTDTMVPKGSIAIDGVSLTIAALTPGRFSVALIPTTLNDTTLGALRVGDAVNIELDVIGKYVYKAVSRLFGSPGDGNAGRMDKDFLRRLGWDV